MLGTSRWETGAPFADFAGRCRATVHAWDSKGGLRNPQRYKKV